MSKTGINLQDNFLNQIRKEKIPVTVYLLNGAKLSGLIKGFDNFIVFLKNETQNLVYKHAISTIVPQKSLKSFEVHEGTEERPALNAQNQEKKTPEGG